MRYGRERGGIITGWLLQMLVILGLVSLVAYELLSVVVTNVSLDDTARQVARATRDEYRASGSLDTATLTAHAVAEVHDARVVEVVEDGDELVVELERDAPTLLVHRVPALEDRATATASVRVERAP